MRRAEITARSSRRSCTRLRVVYLALHEFSGGTAEKLQSLSRARAHFDSRLAVDHNCPALFALSGRLLERADEIFHLAFLSDRKPHVVWKRWEQSADMHLALFHCLDQRHDRSFAIEHDEVGL